MRRQQNKYQQTKLDRMKTRLASECISRWIKNCWYRLMTEPDLSMLRKGLNFAVMPHKIPVVDKKQFIKVLKDLKDKNVIINGNNPI